MLDELKRITGKESIIESMKKEWAQYKEKIISQAKLEKGVRVMSMVSFLLENDEGTYVFIHCSFI